MGEDQCPRCGHITTGFEQQDFAAKQAVLAAKDAEIERLRGHLVHIGEYWNGSETDGAMSDALAEIKATVTVALETAN